MSSTIQKQVISSAGQLSTQFVYGSAIDQDGSTLAHVSTTGENNDAWLYYKPAYMSQLYPNSTAHPTSAYVEYSAKKSGYSTSRVYLWVDDTNVFSQDMSTSQKTYSGTYSPACITSSTRSSIIKWSLYHLVLTGTYLYSTNIILYFTKYSLSASAGTGISSASAKCITSDSDAYNTANAYGGDTVQFSCSVNSGYVFDGWYNGSTRVSTNQTYTVSDVSADYSLTAKATLSQTYTVVAVAGTNILAAYVSASSVTSGTSVTFSCCLAHGATFDGWYNSSTRVSTSQTYTATITANTTLTAKASSTITRSRYIRYGDTTKYSDTQTGSIAIGYGSTIATLTGNESKTLVCSGKYMSYNVTVGNKTLSCSNKIASDNINVYYSAPSLTFNKSLQNGSNTLIDLSGWCVTDYLEVPSGYTYWEINHGGTHSSGSCFNEYDANKAYKSYWGASSNPRQNRFDYPNDTRYVRCTFKMDNLKNCYFRVSKNSDYSNPVYLFRGANV